MAFLPLKFAPGINKDLTAFSGEGGWTDMEKVRFRAGFPQKIGGWAKYSPTQLLGTCRQLWLYSTSFGETFLCLGTNEKVYLEVGSVLYDITPIRVTLSSTNTDNAVATSNTSTTVTLNLGAVHGAADGDYVTIAGVTGDIGGVPNAEINTNHQITYIDTDSFSITVTTAASSTVAAGGGTSITMAFEVSVGNVYSVYGYGFGTGTWDSAITWGTGSDTPIFNPQQDWWFSHIDNDMIFSLRNGAIYYWVRGVEGNISTALSTRGVTLQSIATSNGYDPNAVPVKTTQTFVSQNDQHLIAFGAVPFGSVDTADFDPLLIRWASQDAPSQWTPAVTNSAGSIRLSRGSEIVCALPTRQEILVWTNSNLYAMQYLGTTDVFSINAYADTISIMGPRANVNMNDVTYWMGRDKFYVYDGRVNTLPCTLRDYVFQNINKAQGDQVICGTNEEWSEIWWFYAANGSITNNKYIIYNYMENIWYHGSLARTAWLDSSLKDNPISIYSDPDTSDGYVYNQESGLDDDGAAMTAYIKSNDFDLGEGDQLMLTRRLIPDLDFSSSTNIAPTLTMEVSSRYFPGIGLVSDTPDTQTVAQSTLGLYTQQVFVRVRGRQMAITIQSTDAGVHWRLGTNRLDLRPDGRK